jgi:hypothetical protein
MGQRDVHVETTLQVASEMSERFCGLESKPMSCDCANAFVWRGHPPTSSSFLRRTLQYQVHGMRARKRICALRSCNVQLCARVGTQTCILGNYIVDEKTVREQQ